MGKLNLESHILPPGTRLRYNAYEIICGIKSGGFGIVYKAKDIELDQIYALKELFPEGCGRDCEVSKKVIPSPSLKRNFEDLKNEFIKEAKALLKFEKHPNIVHVKAAFPDKEGITGTAYIVMEFIKGDSLQNLIERENGLRLDNYTLSLYLKILDAIEYIHNAKFIHFDLSPKNIMIREEDGEPVIIDFGLAKHYDNKTLTSLTTVQVSNQKTQSLKLTSILKQGGFTNLYAPPEQKDLNNWEKFDPRFDIYALGAILFNMLTNVEPPEDIDMIRASNYPKIKEDLLEVIKKSMALNKEMRYKNVSILRDDFLKAIDKLGINKEKKSQETQNQDAVSSDQGWGSSWKVDYVYSTSGSPYRSWTPTYATDKKENKSTENKPVQEKKSIREEEKGKKNYLVDLLDIKLGQFSTEGWAPVHIDGKWNFINKEGNKYLSEEWFDGVSNFNNGWAPVSNGTKVNYINPSGELMLQKWLEYPKDFYKEKWAKVSYKGKENFMDTHANLISDKWFDEVFYFSNGWCMVQRDKKRNFINVDKKYISKEWFDDASNFKDGFAKIKKEGHYNFITTEGQILSKVWYDKVRDFYEGYALVNKDNQYWFINREDRILNEEKFDYADSFESGWAMVRSNHKYNLIDLKGNYWLKDWSDEITKYKSLIAIKNPNNMRENNWVIFNLNGKFADKWFDDVSFYYQSEFPRVEIGSRYNFINPETLKLISEEWFDDAFPEDNNRFKVEKNGRKFYIDKNGKEIKG